MRCFVLVVSYSHRFQWSPYIYLLRVCSIMSNGLMTLFTRVLGNSHKICTQQLVQKLQQTQNGSSCVHTFWVMLENWILWCWTAIGMYYAAIFYLFLQLIFRLIKVAFTHFQNVLGRSKQPEKLNLSLSRQSCPVKRRRNPQYPIFHEYRKVVIKRIDGEYFRAVLRNKCNLTRRTIVFITKHFKHNIDWSS